MITRNTALLQLLIGLFAAGAVTCAVGLVRTWAGYPVQTWELLLFLFVACTVTGYGWQQLVKAEYARERGLQAREKVITAERQIAVAAKNAALAQPVTLIPNPEYDDAKAGEVETFFRAGAAAGGYSIRRLKGVVGSTTWGRLIHFYGSEAGWNVLVDLGGDDGNHLADKWTVEMVLTEIATGHFPLPPFPVRDIRPFVRDTTLHNAKRAAESGAGAVVIENGGATPQGTPAGGR